MKTKIFLLSHLLLIPLLNYAQTFEQVFKLNNSGGKIIHSGIGNYYVLGKHLIKYDESGNQLWSKGLTSPWPSYLELRGVVINRRKYLFNRSIRQRMYF